MELERVVIVPGDATANVVTSEGTRVVPLRTVRCFDDFAAALRTQTPAQVAVDDQPYLPRPQPGTIAVCPLDVLEWSLARQLENQNELAAHTVLVDIVRTHALDWAERLGLAAVVETSQYLKWQNGARPDRNAELYGRKDVGLRMDATLSDSPLQQGGRYALLCHPDYPSLPALLAAYLTEYARDLT